MCFQDFTWLLVRLKSSLVLWMFVHLYVYSLTWTDTLVESNCQEEEAFKKNIMERDKNKQTITKVNEIKE